MRRLAAVLSQCTSLTHRVRHSVKIQNKKCKNGAKFISFEKFCFSIFTECRSLRIIPGFSIQSKLETGNTKNGAKLISYEQFQIDFALPFSLNADPCYLRVPNRTHSTRDEPVRTSARQSASSFGP